MKRIIWSEVRECGFTFFFVSAIWCTSYGTAIDNWHWWLTGAVFSGLWIAWLKEKIKKH